METSLEYRWELQFEKIFKWGTDPLWMNSKHTKPVGKEARSETTPTNQHARSTYQHRGKLPQLPRRQRKLAEAPTGVLTGKHWKIAIRT